MGHEPSFDPDRNLLTLAERRLVFHCHHYNVFLQRSIEDALGEDALDVQVSAAAESAREMLQRLWSSPSPFEARLTQAAAIFGQNGFGKAELSELHAGGGRVRLATSHYATGWQSRWGRSARPVCHFATGFWAGALAAATGLAPERVRAVEETCAAAGGETCCIRLEVR